MSVSAPFATLVAIAQRSREVAIDLPLRSNAQMHWNGLGFNLLGQRFVAPMDEVAELMRLPQSTRLPGTKSFVMGVANVRGNLMAILDLASFFGEKSDLARILRRVLAVEEDDLYLGFLVDESLGMQHFPSNAFKEEVEDVEDRFKPYVNGEYVIAGVHWPVLSLKRLAADPKLQSMAGSG